MIPDSIDIQKLKKMLKKTDDPAEMADEADKDRKSNENMKSSDLDIQSGELKDSDFEKF